MEIGPFHIGDQPSTPVALHLVEDFDIDEDEVTKYLSAAAELVDSNGVTVATLAATLDGEELSVEWSAQPFKSSGVHRLLVTLQGTGPTRRRLSPVPIVVEDEGSGWHTLASARSLWGSSDQLDDVALWTYLDAAREAVMAYAGPSRFAPVPLPPQEVEVGTWILDPENPGYEKQVTGPVSTTGYQVLFAPAPKPSPSLRQAQLLHARALWNVSISDSNGAIGFEGGAVVTVRPLDGTVRALIRPKRGIPGIA